MLGEYDVMPTVPTANIDRAKAFYEGVLGLVATEDAPDGVIYNSGSCQFLLYKSNFAGSNEATCMSFVVPDQQKFDEEVENLRSSGIEFATFDIDGGSWEDGVLSFDGSRAVWFSDPDGNILNVEVR